MYEQARITNKKQYGNLTSPARLLMTELTFQLGPSGFAQFLKVMQNVSDGKNCAALKEALTYVSINGQKRADLGRHKKIVDAFTTNAPYFCSREQYDKL